ncbi:MAG: hypothetical protein ACKV2V_08640 [Blastocatellia bacterium]
MKIPRLKMIISITGLILLAVVIVVSIVTQKEADYTRRTMGAAGNARALVLFHPSRDARFSDDIAVELAAGFNAAGYVVDLVTMTSETPAEPREYGLIGVVSNTYYWAPDLPTTRYLARAQFADIPAVGLMCGAGSTARARGILDEALRGAGARVLETRSFWLWRPNDEGRLSEPNREVARQMARRFGLETARTTLVTETIRP